MTIEQLKEIKEKIQQSDGYIYLSLKENEYTYFINAITAYMSDEDVYSNNPSDLFNYTSISEFAGMALRNKDLQYVFLQALTHLNQ